jgi:hypothetical protein
MTDARDRLPNVPISSQIHVVEQRLLRRRLDSARHAAAFRAHLMDRLTSPLALVLATGVGFAFERWNFYRRTVSPADATPPASTSGFSLGGMLQLFTLSVSLAEWAQGALSARDDKVKPGRASPGPADAP